MPIWNPFAAILTKIQDADADTKVDVEEAADEDKVRMDVGGVEAFKLSDVGILTLVKQSGAGVYLSVNQGIPDSSYTSMLFDTELWDIQNEFDASKKIGVADATQANKLHDADGGFVAGDVGKTVWNPLDDTYATVSGFVDDGELDLTDDIMANGESYYLYLSRFTAAEAGKYLLVLNAMFTEVTDGMSMRLLVQKNDVTTLNPIAVASGIGYDLVAGLGIIDMSAGDYLNFYAYQDSGGTIALFGAASYRTNVFIAKLT